MLDYFDTIAAISTPIGTGGIGIVRMSGKDSLDILRKIFNSKKNFDDIKSHTINYGHIVRDEIIIDEVLVSVMKAPNTYTKEDVVEINCHGGMISVKKILETLLISGARLAEKGEFTKRAFLNGRIDLTKAEAVIDIINAKTDLSQEYGIKQLEGKLSDKIEKIRDSIIEMIANIEASIDYPEHDMEALNIQTINNNTKAIIKEVEGLLETAETGRIITNGLETVILGKPNVGKSSLLNALLLEERAIVTDIPGTTRDVLTETINIDGIPINLIDTAGIRQTNDTIEKIGVEKSKDYAIRADLILFVMDINEELTEDEIELLKSFKDKKVILIINKIDLPKKLDIDKIKTLVDEKYVLSISLKEKKNIDHLSKLIKNMFLNEEVQIAQDVLITNIRHKNSLINTLKSLNNVQNTIVNGFTEDFISIDLQDSYNQLGSITGETLEEDIIDRIFSDFCLGK